MPRDDRDPPEGEPDPRLNLENVGFDGTGLDGIIGMTRTSFQVMNAAKLSGFTDAQSFQLARDFFMTMMRFSWEQEQQAGTGGDK